MEPSLAALEEMVDACELDLVVHLALRDPSLHELVADQLRLPPAQRLRRVLPAAASKEALRALRWLARARTPSIVIGGVAAVLQGGPQQPGGTRVEFVSADPVAMEEEMRAGGLTPVDADERWVDVDRRAPWTLPDGGSIALAANVPGTGDYPDLRRDARAVDLDKRHSVSVAHPRDLLRIADASPREMDWARVPGLRALLSCSAEHR